MSTSMYGVSQIVLQNNSILACCHNRGPLDCINLNPSTSTPKPTPTPVSEFTKRAVTFLFRLGQQNSVDCGTRYNDCLAAGGKAG